MTRIVDIDSKCQHRRIKLEQIFGLNSQILRTMIVTASEMDTNILERTFCSMVRHLMIMLERETNQALLTSYMVVTASAFVDISSCRAFTGKRVHFYQSYLFQGHDNNSNLFSFFPAL